MIAVKLAEQVCIIFILLGIGIFLRKKGVVTYDAARMFSNFVLTLVSPALLVQVFQRDLEAQLLGVMGLSFLLAVLFHIVAAVVSRLIYPPGADDRRLIRRMLSVCSNCGYMGIPLMTTIMGEVGMLYAAVYITVFTVYLWTHGIMILRRNRRISLREIFTAPGTIGAIIGLSLFFLQIRLPEIGMQTLGYLTAMNTPLPTIITGVFIADISLRDFLRDRKIYGACAVRLLVLPLLFLGLLAALRVSHWFDGAYTVALAAMISCCCPGALTTILMPARFGMDTEYASGLVAVSTLLSILTIPIVASLSTAVLMW